MLKIRDDGSISGQKREFIKYEKDIMRGKIACPFAVEFLDTQYSYYIRDKQGFSKMIKKGSVVATFPVPLTLDGKVKIKLFGRLE